MQQDGKQRRLPAGCLTHALCATLPAGPSPLQLQTCILHPPGHTLLQQDWACPDGGQHSGAEAAHPGLGGGPAHGAVLCGGGHPPRRH